MKRIGWLLLVGLALLSCEGCRRGGQKKNPVTVATETDFLLPKTGTDLVSSLKPLVKDEEGKQGAKEIDKNVLDANARAADTKALADVYLVFRKANPPKEWSLENFKMYLRREKLTKLRQEMDHDLLEAIYFVDPNRPDQVLAIHKTLDLGGHSTVFTGLPPKVVDLADLKLHLQKQELHVVKQYYTAYSAPMFQKNPPEPRDAAQFLKYLKENAPPAVAKAVESGYIRVAMAADPRNPTHVIACMGKADSPEGHLSILANGTYGAVPTAVIDPWMKAK